MPDHTGQSTVEKYKHRLDQEGGAEWLRINKVRLEPAVKLPAPMTQIFNWFLDYSRGRGSNGFGLSEMTWPGLRCWRREKRMPPMLDFEFDCLFDLDRIYLKTVADKSKKPEGST